MLSSISGGTEEGVGDVSRPLSWQQRLHAIRGAARGLAYLHASDPAANKPPILHRDVKAANILLGRVQIVEDNILCGNFFCKFTTAIYSCHLKPNTDQHGNARLCDAGLARLSPELVGTDVSHVSSVHICGTHGLSRSFTQFFYSLVPSFSKSCMHCCCVCVWWLSLF